MASALTLNNEFSYPIELNRQLTVKDNAIFEKSVAIGTGTSISDTKGSLAMGDSASISSDYTFAFGKYAKANGKYSTSIGLYSETNAPCSIALGIGAVTNSDDANSFIWSGEYNESRNSSKGNGTFSIYPSGGENGFYIGGNTLVQHINEYAIDAVDKSNNVFEGFNTFSTCDVIFTNGAYISSGSFIVGTNATAVFNGSVTVPDCTNTYIGDGSAANTKFVIGLTDKCLKNESSDSQTISSDIEMDESYSFTLGKDPERELEAATKRYVDNKNTKIEIDSKCPRGNELVTLTVNGTESHIYTPKIVAGDHITIQEDGNSGEIKISCDPEIKAEFGGSIKVPIGTIVPIASTTVPEGFLPCDGREVLSADYPDLYSVIGDKFGNTYNTETFKLPNLSDSRFIEGSNVNGSYHDASLPSPKVISSLTNPVANSTLNLPSAHTSISQLGVSTTVDKIDIDVSGSTNNAGSHSHNVDTPQHWAVSLTPDKWSSSIPILHGHMGGGKSDGGEGQQGDMMTSYSGSHQHTFRVSTTVYPTAKSTINQPTITTSLYGGSVSTSLNGGSVSTSVNNDSIYNSANTTVQPKSLTLIYYIKAKEALSDKPVLTINNIEPDDDGNINLTSDNLKFISTNGGTVSGDFCVTNTYNERINFSGNRIIQPDNTKYIEIQSGVNGSNDSGAEIKLYGSNNESNSGQVVINAYKDNSTQSSLIAKPNGNLIWKDKHIVRSINGINADVNGNVQVGIPSVTQTWVFTLDDDTVVSSMVYAEQLTEPEPEEE